ncbi:MAG: FHA domain-containing protein [Bdellovibrionales bacterium]|nr:FHA domain-containing protein [Bdellovibrionales bacterium]
MWAIRILNGPQAGQIFELKEGTNIIGRDPGCDIVLNSPGVSKQHAQLDILEGKTILSDMGSTNGTFSNGIKIQSLRLQGHERLALHNLFFEIVPQSSQQVQRPYSQLASAFPPHRNQNHIDFSQSQADPVHYQPGPASIPYAPSDQINHSQDQGHFATSNSSKFEQKPTFLNFIKNYLEEVVYPGVYKLPELMEFRWVLACFMGAFILFVTSLSSIPLIRILKTSIEKESQRRALTIARTLAKVNRAPLMQGIDSAVSVDIAQREPGVETALIISNVDGNIIAPASQAGQIPDLPFIHEARKEAKEIVRQIDDNTIGALVPIEFYNPETGSQAATACSAVIYNMGSLALDDSRTLSLFIQTFFIALLVGSVLFLFLLKTIEFPLISLNRQLDVALKENRDELKTTYLFPPLQNLVANINSALSRMSVSDDPNQASKINYDRSSELTNLVQMMGFGTIGITAHDLTIQAVNSEFEVQTGIRAQDLVFQSVDKMSDQAMRLSIQDLIARGTENPYQMATNELEIGGQIFELALQSVHGSEQVAYFLVSLLPPQSGGEYS